ncbi:hypothetical protein K438DRAFT_1823685 [Mycena galopus ATCC 62051]|nr:hypothetical protein K438DRAFT_1823685 [Mycena galopus ATCC 62051]
MSKLRLLLLSVLFTNYYLVSGSYSSPSTVYSRDDNTTLSSETFTFIVPLDSHDPNFSDWVNVVCLHPEKMTVNQCNISGFGRCPNPDVSGILVRVPAYLANLLLGIVIMYDPEEASGGVWAQLLTVYSLLISAIIAIYTKGLTRFHSGMTIFLVLSPLSFTLLVYAVLGFCGRPHRLDSILSSRRDHLLPRFAVIVFWIIAIILLVFSNVSGATHFTPETPCAPDYTGISTAATLSLTFLPYIGVALILLTITVDFVQLYPGAVAATFIPLLLLLIALVWATIKSRRSLQQQVKRTSINGRRAKFWAYWELFGKRYQFLHFCGIFLIPMIYWVILNEIRLLGTADNIFSPSFGQVLAVFVVLQPLVQVVTMVPRAGGWFNDLAVVRLATGRQKEFVPTRVNLQEENEEMDSLKRWDTFSG